MRLDKLRDLDILKKQYSDLTFTEPSIDSCIEYCMKKNTDSDNTDEAILLYSSMNYLLELKMKQESPTREYKFNGACFSHTVFSGCMLLFMCACGMLSASSLLHYVFYAVVMLLLLARGILLFKELKSIEEFRELKEIHEKRNEK